MACYIVGILVETRVEDTTKAHIKVVRIARVNVKFSKDAVNTAVKLVKRYWRDDQPSRTIEVREAHQDEFGSDAVLVEKTLPILTKEHKGAGQRVESVDIIQGNWSKFNNRIVAESMQNWYVF